MKHIFSTIKTLSTVALLALTTQLASCSGSTDKQNAVAGNDAQAEKEPKEVVMKYGQPIEEFEVKYDTIRRNQTVSDLLYGFGFNANQIHKFTQCPDSIFNVRKIRPGQA